MLNFFGTFWTYLTWSVQFLLLRHPPFLALTVLLIASLIVAALCQSTFRSNAWKRSYWIAIAQLVCVPATIAVGAIGFVDIQQVPFPGPNRLGLRINDFLFIVSLGLGTYWTWKMRGQRWFAMSLTLLQLWFLFAAGFVAGMALAGTWL